MLNTVLFYIYNFYKTIVKYVTTQTDEQKYLHTKLTTMLMSISFHEFG